MIHGVEYRGDINLNHLIYKYTVVIFIDVLLSFLNTSIQNPSGGKVRRDMRVNSMPYFLGHRSSGPGLDAAWRGALLGWSMPGARSRSAAIWLTGIAAGGPAPHVGGILRNLGRFADSQGDQSWVSSATYVGRTSRNAFSQRVPSTAAPSSGLSLICLREFATLRGRVGLRRPFLQSFSWCPRPDSNRDGC